MIVGTEFRSNVIRAVFVPTLLLFSFSAHRKFSPSQLATSSTGEISGHIYRADSGVPLANALVELNPAGGPGLTHAFVRTAENGSFATAVDPGKYFIEAFRTGFIAQRYGDKKTGPCPNCISVATGQKVDAIDLRLVSDPIITTMPDEAQDVESHASQIRLSPDGSLLALGAPTYAAGGPRLWLYDMHSKRLVEVPSSELLGLDPKRPSEFFLAWADPDTLYVVHQATHHPPDPPPYVNYWIFVRLSGIRGAIANEFPQLSPEVAPDVPPDVEANFEPYGEEFTNVRYTVGSESQDEQRHCHRCSELIVMRRNDGTGRRVITDDMIAAEHFLFDKRRSLVFYNKPIWGGDAIVTFDLDTHRYRSTLIPTRGRLIDQIPNGKGSFVAYRVQGPCTPDDSNIEAETERMRSGIYLHQLIPSLPYHICFVKVP